jgi:uncharacterized membrane protein (UPF0127 family)
MWAALAVAVPFGPMPAVAQSEISRAQPPLATEPLAIHSAAKTYRFHVEVARTGYEQEAGLMFRKAVPPFGGMIFPMQPIREAQFWMHNTIIPLDMLFIRTDGTIARITTAKALDDGIDSSGEPVAAVLELGAGRAAALGIKEGDRVEWQGLPRG